MTNRAGAWIGVAVCLGLFAVYATFRERYIWGSDPFGYYQLGKLFSQGRVTLPTEMPAGEFPALAPLGFEVNPQQVVVPRYTPGLPLFIAIGHWAHAPMFVTPVLGVLSVVLLFFLLRDRVSPPTAAVFSVAWAFMPLTVYGSTMLMSDGAAATALLALLLAYRRGNMAVAGWLLCLAIAVRPTNALFLLPFGLIVRWDRSLLKFGIHAALAGAVYGIYNWRLFGAPWRTGYGDIAASLSAGIFPDYFAFYLARTTNVICPLVALLALVGLGGRADFRWKFFCISWPLVLAVFYSFWTQGGIDRWWWTRFLLPGLPMIFLLAGEGFEKVLTLLRGSSRFASVRIGSLRVGPVLLAAAWVLVALLPVYYIQYGRSKRDLWNRDTGKVHFDAVQRVASIAPPGSLVGTIEHTSTFFVYSSLVPFFSVHSKSNQVVSAGLAGGRRVFLLVEPWNAQDDTINRLLRDFNGREIARYSEPWKDFPLYELTARP